MNRHVCNSTLHAKALAILALAVICLGLPLLGGWLLGMTWDGFWSLPLVPRDMGYVPFLLWPNIFYWLIALALLVWWWRGHSAGVDSKEPSKEYAGKWPWWGYVSALSLSGFWLLAWTRFEWFASLQSLTFTPIWLSFIVLLNAILVKRTGSCPLTHDTLRYLLLFPLSAVFWWGFEYFNRFVNNWLYHGVEGWSPLAYAIHASLAFSTVLPAVAAMAKLLESFPRLQSILSRGPMLPPWLNTRCTTRLVLCITALGFYFIGIAPSLCFPLLWGGPVLVWISINSLLGCPLNLGGVTQGRWGWILTWSFSGLACGFCWELWNIFSLAKWTYQIPWFETLYIYEMPLAGYLGYLPFGLECGLVVMAIQRKPNID